MKPQEVELWARDIIDSVLSGQPVEDSRIELKAKWIEAEKAAPRLGGHANASRGENILWLIGVDERNSSLTNVDVTEKGDWYKAVEKCFDGFAPRLLVDVNCKVKGNTIVALYFDTAIEAPYVIKNSKGSYPEYIVPWREGTYLRATSRVNLLKLRVPIQRLSALISELEFNLKISEIDLLGCSFRVNEFYIAYQSGLIESLPKSVKEKLFECYINIETTNKEVNKWLNEKHPVFYSSDEALYEMGVKSLIRDTSIKIAEALEEMKKIRMKGMNES